MLRKITMSALLPSIFSVAGCVDEPASIGDIGAPDTSASSAAAEGGEANAGGAADEAAGASAEAGGAGGTVSTPKPGGTDPVEEIAVPDPWEISGPVEKLDLLLVLDNSASAEKHQLLIESIPRLVESLVNPPCVHEDGAIAEQPAIPSDACSIGARKSKPIHDLHLGIISSSLGSAGGEFCSEAYEAVYDPTMEDMGHLMGTVRNNVAGYKGLGFLAWDSRDEGERDPDASQDLREFTEDAVSMVAATGNQGCGFEAPMEAWYRFLVDPQPYAEIIVDPVTMQGMKSGVDEALLEQRAAFLRDDSALAILMLSNENDCSIAPTGLGHLVATFVLESSSFNMRPSTSVCEDNPNDPCCISCATSPWPVACAPKDELCLGDDALSPDEDASNLRCFDQKRRFGLDLLYPTSRYTVGLTSPVLCSDSSFADADCDCQRANELGVPCEPGPETRNPLFANPNRRSPETVVLTGMVGVPWQDITASERVPSEGMSELLTPAELRENVPGQEYSYWDMIVGSPKDYVRPRDPYMVESIRPRTGSNPITGDAMEPLSAASSAASPINGHEWNTAGRDLQYACTYSLPTPLDCSAAPDDHGCECLPTDRPEAASPLDDVLAARKPLCQDSEGEYGTVQMLGQAYPSLRQLEVLKDLGDNSVVASVCPRTVDEAEPKAGYAPAMDALAERLGSAMNP